MKPPGQVSHGEPIRRNFLQGLFTYALKGRGPSSGSRQCDCATVRHVHIALSSFSRTLSSFFSYRIWRRQFMVFTLA
jgi:hypothetical protein